MGRRGSCCASQWAPFSCASFTSFASGHQMGFGAYLRVRKAMNVFLHGYISTMAKTVDTNRTVGDWHCVNAIPEMQHSKLVMSPSLKNGAKWVSTPIDMGKFGWLLSQYHTWRQNGSPSIPHRPFHLKGSEQLTFEATDRTFYAGYLLVML